MTCPPTPKRIGLSCTWCVGSKLKTSRPIKSMFLYSARGAMFPLAALVAVQVNAEAECPSLLTLTARSIEHPIPFQDGQCRERSPRFGTKVRDNTLAFVTGPLYTFPLSGLSFQGAWYSVTEGQPVDQHCLSITYHHADATLHFQAGRHSSRRVADVFMNGNSKTTMTRTEPHDSIFGSNTPDKLNFAFEGMATFQFSDEDSGDEISISQAIRIAQGHKFAQNIWWIGHDQCAGGDAQGLLCGPLLFEGIPDNTFLVTYVKRNFQNGSCMVEKGTTNATKDRRVTFTSLYLNETYTIQSFSFEPSWYAASVMDPVPRNCLQINQDGLTFAASLTLSTEVQKAFMEDLTQVSVLGSSLLRIPQELCFTLEGMATFTFGRSESGELFSSSQVIRLGQGHSIWRGQDWWLGNDSCRHEEPFKGLQGLVCGDLFFAIGDSDMQFYMAPWAWVQ